MSDALRNRLLTAVVSQIPLAGGLVTLWEYVLHRPLLAALICLLYEIAVLMLAFGKEVWAELKPGLVKVTAKWINARAITLVSRFHRRYKQQVISDHGTFNVHGLGLINTFALDLEQVFVELRIAPGNPQKANTGLLAERESAGSRPIWDFLRTGKRKHTMATALAIIGPPGSGKTTLLQHVAVTLVADPRRRFGSPTHVPVLLFLRDHAPVITQGKAPTLGKLAQDYFSEKYPHLKPPPDWFERQLKRGKCLVLLDGLDEVAELKQRKAISEWTDKQITFYSDCRFVLTARPLGYREAPLKKADVLEVQPFRSEQVRRFIENWYLASEVKSSGMRPDAGMQLRASQSADDLLPRLRGAPALIELTVNPLLLTMIVIVHHVLGTLPDNRVELYAKICEVLLDLWGQEKGITDPLNLKQKLDVLLPLAAQMMERRLSHVTTKDKDAMKVITEALERAGVTGKSAESFLIDLQAGSGLLQEREAGRWGFAHQTFQEYLTAAHWHEQDSTNHNWSELVSDDWWHETLRLYAAQGDATPVVKACLEVNTVPALALAAECLEEKRELDPDVERAASERLIADLESPDSERRRLAAEAKLSRRLKTPRRTVDE